MRTVVVVGAGIVGAAVASALARRGHDVRLFEQREPGSGVSGGSLAALGTHMLDEDELPALRWACDAWAAFATTVGAALEYRRCGQIRFVRTVDERDEARRWVALERAHGLRPTYLEPAAIRAIEPALTGPILGGTWSPEDAVVNPFQAVRAFVNDARANGCTVSAQHRITAIDTANDRVRGVYAGEAFVHCDAVVLACGPWTASLAVTAGLALPIVPRKAQCCATTAQPATIRTVVGAGRGASRVDAGYTQIQQAPSGQILFNTVLGGGTEAPAQLDAVPEIDRAFLRDSVATVIELFPQLANAELLRSWVRYEAVTPDDRFAIGRAGPEGLFIAAGDGGTGFVRAPAIGRIIADAIDERTSPFRTDLYDPARFERPASSA